jgi:ELWxxDGT repeat protein
MTPRLVADLNPLEDDHHNIAEVTTIGPRTYFAASASGLGRELWMFDQRTHRTTIVKDIVPGDGGNGPTNLLRFGERLTFTYDSQLWTTDGTEEGTIKLADVPVHGWRESFGQLNGTLFFVAGGSDTGPELWKTDGTPGGTTLLRDIAPAGRGSFPGKLTTAGNRLWFFAKEDGLGHPGNPGLFSLWTTDGTESGTIKVRHLNEFSYLSDFTAVGLPDGSLYFTSAPGQLWCSDGTTEGTQHLGDLAPSNSGAWVRLHGHINDRLLFSLSEFRNEFRSISTQEQLTAVEGVLRSDLLKHAPLRFYEFSQAVGDAVYFVPHGLDDVWELWKSDGTVAGTEFLKVIGQGPNNGYPQYFGEADGLLTFMAFNAATGTELWKSDGTQNGTAPTADIWPRNLGSSPRGFTNVNGKFYFYTAPTEIVPRDHRTLPWQLWATDGEFLTTEKYATIYVPQEYSGARTFYPTNFTPVGDLVYFVAGSGTSPRAPWDLWKTDGSPAGTAVIAQDVLPDSLVKVGQVLFFAARVGDLWRTDGTPSGTHLVKDLPFDFDLANMTDYNGVLFFSLRHREIWRSDGTEMGTYRVKELVPYQSLHDAYPDSFTVINDTLYFTVKYREIWKSDGTEAGTFLLSAVIPGGEYWAPPCFLAFNEQLYFTTKSTAGWELWKSDGTISGTVKILVLGALFTGPQDLFAASGSIYFTAQHQTNGWELWKSDGTAEGTSAVANLAREGITNYSPITEFVAVANQLFFMNFVYGTGWALWVTDGTEAGTRSVMDITPFPEGIFTELSTYYSFPGDFAAVQQRLYFTADDRFHGTEMWTLCPACPNEDLNDDTRVDRRDLAILTSNFARPWDITPLAGDLDADGRIGLTDLVRVRDALTPAIPPTPSPQIASPASNRTQSPASARNLRATRRPANESLPITDRPPQLSRSSSP